MLAIALVFLGVSGVFFWLPSFFERVDGLDAGVAAAVAGGVILAGTVVGAVTGGLLADRRVAEDPAAWVRLARRGLVSAAVVALPTLLADGVVVHAGGLLVASTLAGLSIPNLPAHAAEAVPAHIRGLAFSLLSVATALGGAFGPLLVGLVSDGTGSLSIALTPATGLLLAAGLAVPSARSSRGTDPARQRPGVGSGRSR
jgi:predicted MFS family arabinose efflux permease